LKLITVTMFHTSSGRMYAEQNPDHRRIGVPLHNYERPLDQDAVSTEDVEVDVGGHDGPWGERDVGGPVDLRVAMQEYEDMRRELTHLSRTRSQQTQRSGRALSSRLSRTVSTRSRREPLRTLTATDVEAEIRPEAEEAIEEEDVNDEEEFALDDFLRDGRFERRREDRPAKKVGVVFKYLTVQGAGATTAFVKTLPAAVIGTFGPDL
jgi:ATP-binding cassette, subfamily G (WHITE), member 2, SNQ2